jgi:two-component system phosphate regulon sensor histidine kinase PhoR
VELQQGTLETDLAEGPLMILGDNNHLENVFHNLLENAMKYSPGAPEIRIRSMRKPGKVVVQVKDQGIGIPAKLQKKIFEKFYRVPTGNVHDTKGFGLGLYYVSKIIAAHRGQITLESKEGKGSEFTITLPLEK